MERKTVSQGEQKLLILLALQQLGGVTQLQLLRFMVEEDFMNYFVLQLNLCELEEMGQVCMTHQLLGSLYELTEQGYRDLIADLEAGSLGQMDAIYEAAYQRYLEG